MTLIDVLCLGITLLSFCAFGTFVSYIAFVVTKEPLPQAQALLALSKLKDLEDEKIKKVLERFQGPRASAPGIKEQMEEMARKAKAMGFVIDPDADAKKAQQPSTPRPPEPPLPPPPEPSFDYGNFLE